MPSCSELGAYYNVGAQLAPISHTQSDWPYEIANPRLVAFMVPPRDVGGQSDVPLGWRRVWNAEERRRRGNNDLGQSLYYGFPYYGRWVWAAARMLVDKNHISLTELLDKVAEVKARNDKR